MSATYWSLRCRLEQNVVDVVLRFELEHSELAHSSANATQADSKSPNSADSDIADFDLAKLDKAMVRLGSLLFRDAGVNIVWSSQVLTMSNLDVLTLSSVFFSFRGLTHSTVLLAHSARDLLRRHEPDVNSNLDVVG